MLWLWWAQIWSRGLAGTGAACALHPGRLSIPKAPSPGAQQPREAPFLVRTHILDPSGLRRTREGPGGLFLELRALLPAALLRCPRELVRNVTPKSLPSF